MAPRGREPGAHGSLRSSARRSRKRGDFCWGDQTAALAVISGVSPLCYADTLELWWRAHPDGCCGWDPAAEPDVRAWADELDARLEEERERWERPARAGASAAELQGALAIDLRELISAPIDDAKHWVEVRVIDADDAPVRGLALTLIRPDGARERASTDDDGVARWRKLPGGRPRVVFDDDAASFAEVG